MNVNTLTLDSPLFPPVLKNIPAPPTILYVAGDFLDDLLARPRVAIVGSRSMTAYGKAVTSRLAAELARAGVVVVSGLALGTDSVAHQAALDAGGQSIAVLPCGIERVYPARHYQLAQRIMQRGGVLVSEYAGDHRPRAYDFIARNRLVSGISDITLITEAAAKSGTLHTANFALEQGRDVMAVPGNITSLTAAGTNTLIKTGAHVVTHVNDVLSLLGIVPSKGQMRPTGDTPEQQRILDSLAAGVNDGNALLAASKLDIRTFDQQLTMLEITGKVQNLGSNRWSL